MVTLDCSFKKILLVVIIIKPMLLLLSETVETGTTQAAESNEVQIEEILNPSQTEGLEETHQDSVVEPRTNQQTRLELDDVIDDLLDRNRVADPESQIVGEIIMETGEWLDQSDK